MFTTWEDSRNLATELCVVLAVRITPMMHVQVVDQLNNHRCRIFMHLGARTHTDGTDNDLHIKPKSQNEKVDFLSFLRPKKKIDHQESIGALS